jgi:hypothetical protein
LSRDVLPVIRKEFQLEGDRVGNRLARATKRLPQHAAAATLRSPAHPPPSPRNSILQTGSAMRILFLVVDRLPLK